MQFQTYAMKLFAGRAALAAALFGLLLLTGAPKAEAHYDDNNCRHRIEHDEAKLHQAAYDHGWGSRQAEKWRYRLINDRQRCYQERGRWWDGDARSWHTDHDWDRDWDHYRDHDRDHDRNQYNRDYR